MTLATANRPNSGTEFGRRPGAAPVLPVQTVDSRVNPVGVASAEAALPKTDARQDSRKGFFSRSAHALRDLLLELGLFGPSRLWYSSSETISPREKTYLDAQIQGIIQ